MKKLLFILVIFFSLVVVAGCNARQSRVKFKDNAVAAASDTATSEDVVTTIETVGDKDAVAAEEPVIVTAKKDDDGDKDTAVDSEPAADAKVVAAASDSAKPPLLAANVVKNGVPLPGTGMPLLPIYLFSMTASLGYLTLKPKRQ